MTFSSIPCPARTDSERGSMPIAMLLVAFVLTATIALGALLAWQITSARGEQLNTYAAWALEDARAYATTQVGIAGTDVSALPHSAPATWIPDSSGAYYWRWWIVQHTTVEAPVVEVIVEITLTSAPGAPTAPSHTRREFLIFDTDAQRWGSLYLPMN